MLVSPHYPVKRISHFDISCIFLSLKQEYSFSCYSLNLKRAEFASHRRLFWISLWRLQLEALTLIASCETASERDLSCVTYIYMRSFLGARASLKTAPLLSFVCVPIF